MATVNQAVNQASSSLRQQSAKTHGAEGASRNQKELGKQDFLNLMMTQLAHQDPLDPMDSNKMMQQMTSMGTVEQLQGMNRKMESSPCHSRRLCDLFCLFPFWTKTSV